jgi:hypothetical protein
MDGGVLWKCGKRLPRHRQTHDNKRCLYRYKDLDIGREQLLAELSYKQNGAMKVRTSTEVLVYLAMRTGSLFVYLSPATILPIVSHPAKDSKCRLHTEALRLGGYFGIAPSSYDAKGTWRHRTLGSQYT